MKMKMKIKRLRWLVIAPLLGICIPVSALPLLYGITGSGGSASSLYTVDPFTGATTLVGATGFTHLTGIDFDPTSGTLYAVQSDLFGSGNTALFTVNTTTGAATSVGTTGAQIPDITIGSDSVIRGWSEFDGSTSDDPVVIDNNSGAATKTISSLGTAQTGVASLDSTHIYVKVGGELFSVDVTTGAAAFLFSTGFSNNNLLENIPTGGLLTGTRTNGGTQFYSIDTSAQTTTALGFASGVQFSAIAYFSTDVPANVPAPATLALFGLGLAGLGWSRRKKA